MISGDLTHEQISYSPSGLLVVLFSQAFYSYLCLGFLFAKAFSQIELTVQFSTEVCLWFCRTQVPEVFRF